MKKNILIVEDEIVTAMDIKEALISLGYNVIGIAKNIEKAIQLLEQNSCDLALLDITLKNNEDGITLSETIAKKYNIPFIFLTANDKSYTIERAIKHEPYGYILKPFKDAELKVTVELALKKFEETKELTNKLLNTQKHYTALEKNFLNDEGDRQKRFSALKYGYIFDHKEIKLFLEDKEITLNKKEKKLFEILLKNRQNIVPNEIIENYLYDGEVVGEGALRGVLFRLRQKVDKNLISSHSSLGYKIELENN